MFYVNYLLTSPPLRALRVRAHNFILPPKDNRNFVSRVLYEALCPLPTKRSSLCLICQKAVSTTDYINFTYFVYGTFYALVNLSAFVSKVD